MKTKFLQKLGAALMAAAVCITSVPAGFAQAADAPPQVSRVMVHFALADATGKSVAVEYVDNEMVVTETPILTNFYLAEGEKQGIGTEQSHTRYDILTDRLKQSETMSETGVRDALGSVSKGNFGDSLSTEWSIVFNQAERKATYYHRENYKDG